jgi:uncharacterized coiled-coil protein SlyX
VRSALAGLLLAALTILSGCATRTEVSLRERAQQAEARVKELEQIVANKDDDLGYLMLHIAKQESYIGELQRGAMWQAGEMARLRNNCDL